LADGTNSSYRKDSLNNQTPHNERMDDSAFSAGNNNDGMLMQDEDEDDLVFN
jgi:hypothetical protein